MRALPVPDPGVPDARSATRYLLWRLRQQRRSVVGGMFFGIVWMVSQALLPAAAGRTIDAGIIGRSSGELVRWSLVVLGLGLVKAASGIMRHRNALANFLAAAYATVQVVTRKTAELGATLPKLVAAGDVVAVGTADISEIGGALDITARLSGAIASIAVVAVVMLAISPPLGLIVLVGVPVLSALTSLLLRPLHERQRRYRSLQGELTGRAVDIAAGLRVLRGIGGEGAFANRYRRESQGLRGAAVSVTRVEAGFAVAEVLMPGLITAGVTFLAARFALDRELTVGQLVAFYGYATFLALPLTTLMEAADLVTRGHVAAKRVVRILNLEPEITDSEQAAQPPAAGGALTDAESGLHAEPGMLLAVACAEPNDADALAERLSRFAADGSPALGGVPLADLPLAEVRSRILLARNSDALFSGTLRDELDSSGTATPEQIAAAIRTACAEDVIEALPDGLDTEVTDGGRTFSGGQLQRLRLARALLTGHEYTVFVEPTSAVDAHTEVAIAERLAELHDRVTNADANTDADAAIDNGAHAVHATHSTIVFTTSPLMLDRAHRVAYVVDGAVVATGTHHELLAAEPGYAAVVTRGESAQEPEAVSAETRTV
jgi:ABC-type multidrug transport system fused ATPase/permease subunit